jgi:hypothetical protein
VLAFWSLHTARRTLYLKCTSRLFVAALKPPTKAVSAGQVPTEGLAFCVCSFRAPACRVTTR